MMPAVATDASSKGCLIDLITLARTSGIPFAVPKQLLRVTESDIVKDVLHALQGSSGVTVQWSKTDQSLARLLRPFLAAAMRLRTVDKFIRKVSESLVGKFPGRTYPTLEAFTSAVSIRLKFLRQAVLEKEHEAVQASGCVTLLDLFQSLSWLFAAAKFLDYVVKHAVPDRFTTYDAANLSAHILTFLYEALDKCSLLKDGGEEGYRTVLLLFVGSLWPHARVLDTWLQEGSLVDPFGELYFYANSSSAIRDTTFWQSGYRVRCRTPVASSAGVHDEKLACPSFIEPIAMSVLSSGKSLQLLRQVQEESQRSTQGSSFLPNASVTQPLFDQFCSSLKKLLVGDNNSSTIQFDLERLLGLKASTLTLPTTPTSNTRTCENVSILSLTASGLPPLDDKDLRKAIYLGGCDSNSSTDLPSEFTTYFLGDGCGRILHSHLSVAGEAMRKLLASPTDLPSSDDFSEQPDHRAILEWLQRVEFGVTPSSTVIVQECLVSFMVNRINAVGTELLRKLMGDWYLMEELALLRALYLMGSGDLLQQFSFVLFNKLDRGECWDDFYELNTMLQESVRSSADAALYPTLDSLVVKMESSGTSNASGQRAPIHHPVHFSGRSPMFGIDILEDLRFECKVAWPLELIIDNEAIKKYNQVMCFLLKVKRAKQALDKACRWTWKGDSAGYKPQLLLQMKLMHFVNTLHHYVMDQVLYTSWLDLCEGMATARSLDEVISCHDTYLIAIQKQCFVAPDKLWTLISSRVKTILGLALDFYSIQRSIYGAGSSSAGSLASKCQLDIENVAKQFDECIAFLLRVLSFKLNVGHFPHLTELITRINYNNHYISESGQLLTPIPDLHRLKK